MNQGQGVPREQEPGELAVTLWEAARLAVMLSEREARGRQNRWLPATDWPRRTRRKSREEEPRTRCSQRMRFALLIALLAFSLALKG